ncbi:MAG: FAD-dependent thymidylate synthase [candidate division WOR-3 bacterium]|nr:FAD-dependent thymidylate synthase [candidate division WOR-3 bacterium]MCX7756984.1 FAD-dependent thymidylate synthase [candidate division WOR-3 bacterium]MDW7987843.1 FAD-dependent thymidylate synthase [candidate division WOR-3 bacterium]
MKIVLAGYNIDLEGLKKQPRILTPEVFSAAYARISRSDKEIPELRKIARTEIKKARDQNRRVIYEMGHHSIAEHSVFNFDLMGISRLAVEKIEAHRLVSYTEASQRYIKWSADYVIPKELKKTKLEALFQKTVAEQLNAYYYLIERLNLWQKENLSGVNEKELPKVWEDARYVTPLASKTQLGMTINGRSLELMIRRLASQELKELKELGKKLYRLAVKVAPSIILFYKATDYDRKTYWELKENYPIPKDNSQEDIICQLIDYTKDADDKLLTTLLWCVNKCSYNKAQEQVQNMTYEKKLELVKQTFKYARFYDPALREYEHCYLTYELILSGAAFAQLKRHRMATLTVSDYDIDLGITIPESIIKANEESYFRKIIELTEKTYRKIAQDFPNVAPYVLTQAHRRRVLLTVNLRELYHIARLRMDRTAQWDIRKLVSQMVNEAKRVMPLATLFCTSKEHYEELYNKYFKGVNCEK